MAHQYYNFDTRDTLYQKRTPLKKNIYTYIDYLLHNVVIVILVYNLFMIKQI